MKTSSLIGVGALLAAGYIAFAAATLANLSDIPVVPPDAPMVVLAEVVVRSSPADGISQPTPGETRECVALR